MNNKLKTLEEQVLVCNSEKLDIPSIFNLNKQITAKLSLIERGKGSYEIILSGNGIKNRILFKENNNLEEIKKADHRFINNFNEGLYTLDVEIDFHIRGYHKS